jgi:hypothetical protein
MSHRQAGSWGIRLRWERPYPNYGRGLYIHNLGGFPQGLQERPRQCSLLPLCCEDTLTIVEDEQENIELEDLHENFRSHSVLMEKSIGYLKR